MKKIFLLLLLSITIMAQKNYSQTLDQHRQKPVKIKCLCETVAGNETKQIGYLQHLHKKTRHYNTYDGKEYRKTCKNYQDVQSIYTGVPVNVGSIYLTIEDIYKWKWEQASKGTLFSY